MCQIETFQTCNHVKCTNFALGTRIKIGSVNRNLVRSTCIRKYHLFFYTQTQNTCSKYNSKSSSFFGKSKILFIAIYLSVILQSPLPLFLLYLYSFRFFIWLIITSENGENSNTCLNCQCLKI